MSGEDANNPIIIIYDNEMEKEKKKPLRKIISDLISTRTIEKEPNFKEKLYIHVSDNLYILTNPLVNGEKECEIEDLFTVLTLSKDINGKKFSTKAIYDTSKFYGKQIFSDYVSKNYKEIDFSGFKPLLDQLSEICNTYK